MKYEVLFDLARENAERGYYVVMLKDLPDKVAIIDHYKFVEGWRARRDIAVFEYITFCTPVREDHQAVSEYFNTNNGQDIRDFKRLEEYGIIFKKTGYYLKIKNIISLSELGS